MRLRFSAWLLGALLAAPAWATSVVPPTFAELVREADAIYRGQVVGTQVRRVALPDGNGSLIKTFVTFAVERVLKGSPTSEVVLEFLGGTLGDESLEVSGMPKFSAGAREIVFVQRNGVQFCPLVALTHGRYRVAREGGSGREHILRDNGRPLTAVAEVELPMTALPEPVRAAGAASAASLALGRDAFETSIAEEARNGSAPDRAIVRP